MTPPIFRDLDLDAALARSKEEGRLLLVYLTDPAALPCQQMDEHTWSDPSVVERLAKEAIAIRVDVVADTAAAKRLRAKWEPSVVAFKDGEEIDRRIGPQRPDTLFDWLDGLARGETCLQGLRRQVAEAPNDLFVRMDLASALVSSDKPEDGTAEYLWIWKDGFPKERPDWLPLKHTEIVTRLQRLFSVAPSAREPFIALRDASAPDLDAPDAAQAVADWCALNDALGQPEKTLTWFDENRERASATPELRKVLHERLERVLIAADRWADLGRLYDKPVDTFREHATLHATLGAQLAQMKVELEALPEGAPPGLDVVLLASREKLREWAQKLVRALHAAARHEEAKEIAVAASAADDSPEMSAALEGRYTVLTPAELLNAGRT